MIAFPNTIPFEITRDEMWAINKVVEYLWDDESKDYRNYKENDHIFRSLKTADELRQRAAERFRLHDKQVR